jgi:8-oxo-dGTP pyrophosphatase MutT (NUDIX family)
MAQIYRIYINQAALIITEIIPESISGFQQIDSQQFDFGSFYQRIKADGNPVQYVLQTPNAKRFFKTIKNSTTTIKAAGGVVRNEENRYLFIFRKGKWDLPKGKLDEGEKPKKAAVREVEEECGIRVTKLGDKMANTYHIYEEADQLILKKTNWYKMYAEDQPHLQPQLEEDITRAEWLSTADFPMVKTNTYPLIADLMTLIESD